MTHTHTHTRTRKNRYIHTLYCYAEVCDDGGLFLGRSISKGPQCLLEIEHALDYELKLLWQ